MDEPQAATPRTRPRRHYTVSAKVLEANRRNLEKARAVPKEIRYRRTERRRVACRQNLLKARARQPVGPPAVPLALGLVPFAGGWAGPLERVASLDGVFRLVAGADNFK